MPSERRSQRRRMPSLGTTSRSTSATQGSGSASHRILVALRGPCQYSARPGNQERTAGPAKAAQRAEGARRVPRRRRLDATVVAAASGGIRNAQASRLSDACRRERRNPSSIGARTDTSVSKKSTLPAASVGEMVTAPPAGSPAALRSDPGRRSAAGNAPRPPRRSHLGGTKCPSGKSEGRDAAVAGPYRIEGGHLRVEALPATEVLSPT